MGSRKLALGLMGVLVFFLFIGSIIPQKAFTDPERFSEWKNGNPALFHIVDGIGLTRTYTSWWFLSALGILFLNTLAYTTEHGSRLLKKQWASDEFKRLQALPPDREVTLPSGSKLGAILDSVHSVLKRQRFALYPLARENALFAVKGRLNDYGVLLIHTAVLLVFLASTVTAFTRFSGIIEITEGQTVFDRKSDYAWTHESAFGKNSYRGFAVSLMQFIPHYYPDGKARSLESDLILSNKMQRNRQRVAVSSPITYSGATVYQRDVHGTACLFRLSDKDGRSIDNTYVLFDKQKKGHQLRTRYQIRNSTWVLTAILYPDAYTAGEELRSRSFLIRNPLLKYTVSEGGNTLSSGTLSQGTSVMIGNRKLTWRDVRYWSSYWITRDRGEMIIYAAFLAGILGLLLILLTEEKAVLVSVVKEGARARIELRGRASRFPYLFQQDLADMARQIGDEGAP